MHIYLCVTWLTAPVSFDISDVGGAMPAKPGLGAALEELEDPFVLLCGSTGLECAEIPPFHSSSVWLPRVQAIVA
jgi:hypothetical protein